jgi:serine/threonine protein kinase
LLWKLESDAPDVLKLALSNDNQAQERMRGEIAALKKLAGHPNVLHLIDAYDSRVPEPESLAIQAWPRDTGNAVALITEYCALGSLERHDTSSLGIRAAKLDTILETFHQVLEGVAHAHRNGIVHRDIKPANVLRREDGTAVLGDFGIALDIGSDQRLTELREKVGPRFYIAPELRDGRLEEVTPASDVYSLGKLLHWMLSGAEYDRENHRDPRHNIIERRRDKIFEHVHGFLDGAITLEAQARYSDAGIMLLMFENLQHHLRLRAPVLDPKFANECQFCHAGEYYEYHQPSDNRATSLVNQRLGLNSPSALRVLKCSNCGHLEFFDIHEIEAPPPWQS